MANESSNFPRVQAIRKVVDEFLAERLQAKLDKVKAEDVDKQQKERERFRRENWVADAARRVGQIQMVTHALKYSHPDARGTNLFFRPEQKINEVLVGTHALASPTPDVVGNAAALDVNKFLNLEVEGKSLLDMAVEKDSDFLAALSSDEESAIQWAEAFAAVTGQKEGAVSSTLVRQVFFPTDCGEYHLLAPLFPTSFVQHLYERINHERFSEESRIAREARKNGQSHPVGFREYPHLTVLRFGGTKPQNISQLNSERRGEVYLLPSLPPHWQSKAVKPPFYADSVFPRIFGYRRVVRELTEGLRSFLKKVQDYTNVNVRAKRADMVSRIIDELVQYAACVHQLEPGWSLDNDCRLNEEEKLWLDSGRRDFDQDFRVKYESGAWRKDISERFARWLNRRIEGKSTPMGDPEFKEWKSEVEEVL